MKNLRSTLIVVLVVLTAGWMLFDGIHALVTGDFVTPSSGEYAGQLGPWAAIPRGLGVEPRSVAVKVFFVAFGTLYLGALAAFVLKVRAGRLLLIGFAIVALLYLPFGTLTSVVVLTMLAR